MFLFNLAADALIFFLIRADAFPEIQRKRVWCGAVVAALSYTVWYIVGADGIRRWEAPAIWFSLVNISGAVMILGLLLVWIFRAGTPSRFFQAVRSGCMYLFLMGGFGHCFRRILLAEKNIFPGGSSASGKQSVPEEAYLLMAMTGLTVFLLLQRRKKHWPGEEEHTYEVEICRKGRRIREKAWYDSGNLLVSQMTGRGVCILVLEDALKLLEEEEKPILQYVLAQEEFPWHTMTERLWSGIYPVSYTSLGKKDGWLPGIYVDQIMVKRNDRLLAEVKGLIGISTEQIFTKGNFSVLLPADIFRK